MARRYAPEAPADRSALDRAYANAMAGVAARFPDDPDLGVLYAEALMDVQPWDYWQAGGTEPKGGNGAGIATLERILAPNPDPPGALALSSNMANDSAPPARAPAATPA